MCGKGEKSDKGYGDVELLREKEQEMALGLAGVDGFWTLEMWPWQFGSCQGEGLGRSEGGMYTDFFEQLK